MDGSWRLGRLASMGRAGSEETDRGRWCGGQSGRTGPVRSGECALTSSTDPRSPSAILQPLLWLFVSLELVLQTTRFFLTRVSCRITLPTRQLILVLLQSHAPPPGILNTILPLISQFSPQLGMAIQTGVKYLDLVSILITDIGVVIFCIGVVITIGRWKTGGAHSVLIQEMAEAGSEAWGKVKGEL